ncbi:hypothetical protein ACH5RR_016025 [Cinchona calisaya]|uniref:Uncharacterized protein n=1 Tax=Cinchona calisaya TaxID=153742 RepID=A0ABD2ZUU6_9GENT
MGALERLGSEAGANFKLKLVHPFQSSEKAGFGSLIRDKLGQLDQGVHQEFGKLLASVENSKINHIYREGNRSAN